MSFLNQDNIENTLSTLMTIKTNNDILKHPTKINFKRYQFSDDEKKKFIEFLLLHGLNLRDLEKELEEHKSRIDQIQTSIEVIRKLLMTSDEIEKGKKEIIDFVNSIHTEPVTNSEKEK